MKILRKILATVLALAMLFALCACGKDNSDKKDKGNKKDKDEAIASSTTDNSGLINYQVTVLDGQGEPMTNGVVVKFLKDGEQVAMQKTDANGVAAKELEKGDYTVELMFTDSSVDGSYDQDAAVLSADKPTLELALVGKVGAPLNDKLIVDGNEFDVYAVNTGSTSVPVLKNVRNYFLFTPTKGGTYEFRVDNADIKIGYYGSQYFVQTISAVDVVNNVVTISISDSALGGSYVIGLDGLDEDTEAILGIIRTGDPSVTIEDLPWTEYKTTHTPAPYTLDLDGKALKYIDVTAKTEDIKVIYNESDGYYHYGSANGPIVLVHLGVDAPYYSLQYILNLDGKFGQHGAKICEYFFDEDGEFLKKENYGDILSEYFDNMDQTAGVYPLTDDLKYILQNGCKQWWDKNDPDYSADFAIPNCNPEIGWMFALCYVG